MNWAVEFLEITKQFGDNKANDQISFKIPKGQIFGIIGENGAGKSTLMSMLSGLISPTSGVIKINNRVVQITNPNQAQALGIGMVHQHFQLVDNYTNLQNIVLGAEYIKRGQIYWQPAIDKITKLQNQYHLHFDLHEKTQDATVATQQKVEIIKMLYKDADILIFDEPTAVLNPQEIQGLLNTMLAFKKANKTTIFISHKLQELTQVVDAAVVIRHGKVSKIIDPFQGVSQAEIALAMVGNHVVLPKNDHAKITNQTLLQFNNVSANANKPVKAINFALSAGEILAIAGVEGNGQETLEYLVSGLIKPTEGSIHVFDPKSQKLIDASNYSVKQKQLLKIAYVPSDRHKHGLVLDFNLADNAIIRQLNNSQVVKYGLINQQYQKQFLDQIIADFDVRGSGLAKNLSGGNQQKLVVGREMLSDHQILVLIQPTRGLDVGAISKIHEAILKLKQQHKAILLISYELDEVFALADSVAVINQGKLSAKLPISEISREQIGLMMTGMKWS